MTVVDCHAHIFPPLHGACGFPDAETHLLYQQRAMHTHGNQPVRRLRDHAVVPEKHLWDALDASEAGRAGDVRFRVGRYGRFEWEQDGEAYYVQFLPPGLQGMAAPPAFMATQMDYAGIRTAVLQNDAIYGNLSAYFSEAMRRHPGRFIGLARVDEAFAHRDDQIAALTDAVQRLGMKGLYFSTPGFFRNGYREYYTDPSFRPFWDAVRALGIPVFWVFFNQSPAGDFGDEMRLFLTWLARYPDVPSVLVHGLPTGLWEDEADRVRFPGVRGRGDAISGLFRGPVPHRVGGTDGLPLCEGAGPSPAGLRPVRAGPPALGFGHAQCGALLHLPAGVDLPPGLLHLYGRRGHGEGAGGERAEVVRGG